MQSIEILALVALAAGLVILLRRSASGLRHTSPLFFQAMLGVSIGVFAAALLLVLQVDFVPDALEEAARPLLFAALVVVLLVVAWREFA